VTAFLWTNSYLSEISADLATIRAAGIDVLFSAQMSQGPVWAGRPVSASDAQMLAYLDALHAAGLQTMLEVQFLGKYVVSGRPNKMLGPAGYTANIIPTMTSNTAPSGVASSSSQLNPGYAAWKALDHQNADIYGWFSSSSGPPFWLRYQFASAHVVTRYAVTSRNEASPRPPKTWELQGSNDGATWDTLDSQTDITDWAALLNERKVFDIANATPYVYYRLYITAGNNATYVGVGELEMMTEGNELANLTAYVNKWKTHPAVWGWYADDEGGAEYPIATRQQVYNTIKAAHPAGQVWETHYALVAGAYSPDVHDVFAMDAGSAGVSYVYKYDDTPSPPHFGCISRTTGLVTSAGLEANALDGFRNNLISLKAALDAAGETNYLVCMQAFKQTTAGPFAMPPSVGLSKIFAEVQAAGWNFYGTGWFLWKSNDASTPGENLDGVGETAYAAQRAELATIAATPLAPFHLYEPPRQVEPTLATYCVKVAGNDITELVDLDTLHRSMSERGEASATIDIPVASENEVPINGLARDVAVEIIVDGGREWLGHVVAVHKPQPQDLAYVLDCAGGWDVLHHCAPWCKGFVETRYDEWVQVSEPAAALVYLLPSAAVTTDTDGQLLLMFPKGGDLKVNQGIAVAYWLFGGMNPDSHINRVTFDWITGGNTTSMYCVASLQDGPYDAGSNFTFFFEDVQPPGSGSADFDVDAELPGFVPGALIFMVQGEADVTLTADTFLQIRNLRIYIDRTTAPRVDEIVAAIDTDVRPGAPGPITEPIGAPLTAFMLDPFMTPADGIAVALTKAAFPPLCGIFANQLVIKNRPTAPPDASRLWTVSEQLTPGLEWGVEVDEEQSVDFVGVAYNILGDATLPDGTPQIIYYNPTAQPWSASARSALTDGGDLTVVEAAFYAEQGYHYLHRLVSGPVTIPYVVQDANGNERPADVIRAWDWVQNVGSLDAATAGPFLVSEVEHQGGIATLTIGAAEAYAYNGPDRMPTKGRYVGAHRVRTKTKQRVSFAEYWKWKHRKDKKKPKMPRHHARYGTIRGWKWQDVEGTYI